MDAEKRHELKQNELAEALRGLTDLSDKRNLAWLAAIAIIILGYAGYKYVGWQARVAQADVAQRLSAISVVDDTQTEKSLADLRALLPEAKDPGTICLIRLKLAEGLEIAAAGTDAAQLAEAEEQYRQILNMAGVLDSIKAAALYRLGLLNETKRDFAKAREYFTQLSEEPRYLGSPMVDLAKDHLAGLDDLTSPVVFAPGSKPLPPPPAVDESQMKSVLEGAPPPPPPPAPAAETPVKPETAPAAEQPGGEAPAAEQPGSETPAAPAAPAEKPVEEPVEPEQP